MLSYGKIIIVLPLLASLAACAGRTNVSGVCSTVKSEAFTQTMSPNVLAGQLQSRDAVGGELVVEFRKDDVLGSPTHQRKCTFFLEPTQANSSGGYFWTAGHCLDPGRDSKYRLRFYVDLATGYAEIPISVEYLMRLSSLRSTLAQQLSAQAQTEVLLALRQKEVDFTSSANATDICLNSIKSGRTFFHEPIAGTAQISCFLYQDLRLIEFKVPDTLTAGQRQVLSFALDRAQGFANNLPIPPNAIIKKDALEKAMSDFRIDWVSAYKSYAEYRENDGLFAWITQNKQRCVTPDSLLAAEICAKLNFIKSSLADSGLTFQAQLFDDVGYNEYPMKYDLKKQQIADLWVFYRQAEAVVDGVTKRPYSYWDLLTNYAWNSGSLKTFSAIGIGGFWGLGWGATVDETGKTRERMGAATYDWNPLKNEKFFYAILPKEQTAENLQSGYAQLRLNPGDSGSMILAGGLPIGVLSTVDGEKTSGGASVLALPSAVEGEQIPEAGTAVTTSAPTGSAKGGVSGCLR